MNSAEFCNYRSKKPTFRIWLRTKKTLDDLGTTADVYSFAHGISFHGHGVYAVMLSYTTLKHGLKWGLCREENGFRPLG